MDNAKKAKIGLIASGVLLALCFLFGIYGLTQEKNANDLTGMIQTAVNLFTLVMIAVYALGEYRTPHGNLLRYAMLVFAVCVMARGIAPIDAEEPLRTAFAGIAGLSAILIAYMSGRLNKIEKNLAVMIAAGILLTAQAVLACFFFPAFHLSRAIDAFTEPICWAVLCLSYLTRYREHQAVGLEEKETQK